MEGTPTIPKFVPESVLVQLPIVCVRNHRTIARGFEPFSFLEACLQRAEQLGPPVVPFDPFLGECSPSTIDYRKKLVPTSSNLSTGGPTQAQRPPGSPFKPTGKASQATRWRTAT